MNIGGLRERLEGGEPELRSCYRSLPRTTAVSPRPPNWRQPLRDAALSEAFPTNPEIVLATGLQNLFVGLKLPLAQQQGSLPQPPSEPGVVSRIKSKSSEQNIGQLRAMALFSYPAPLPWPHPGTPPGVIDLLGRPLAEWPETIEEQRVHGQTSEDVLDLNAVELAVSLRVFLDHCLNASSPRHRCPSPRTKYLLAPGAAPSLKTLSSR
jgi:hypothetical protein